MMHRETADTYRGEIVRLGSWRVAECADGLQWLLQRKVGTSAVVRDDRTPTLAEIGVSKDLSSHAQRVAAIPAAEFEGIVGQWLLQRRDPANAMAGPRWRTLGFCRSRSALIRLWQRASGDDGAALGDLPPHFAPKPRVGARPEPQVGFSKSRGHGKVEPPHSPVFRGALE